MKIQYFPSPTDTIWNNEMQKLLPYLFGSGIDIGCGGRSLNKDVVRQDIDPLKEPDICSPGDKIPVDSNFFDFATVVHNLEHYDDQDAALKEWIRIVRPGGIIGIIHPDVEFTKPQLPVEKNPSLEKDPFNKHYHERTLAEFVRWIKTKERFGFKVLESGPAQHGWSFYCILKKTV